MDIERLKKGQEVLEKLNRYKRSKEKLDKMWAYEHNLKIYVGLCCDVFVVPDEQCGERILNLLKSMLDEKIAETQSEFDKI